MSIRVNIHHHHVGGAVVFHDHEDLPEPHLMLLAARADEGDSYRFLTDVSARPEACRDEGCAYRSVDL